MNIVPPNKAGILMQICQKRCSLCTKLNDFELPFYVHDEAWPDFMSYALTTNIGEVACKRCKRRIRLTYPLVVDSTRSQLLIFVVHGGDTLNIISDFQAHLKEAYTYLPDDLIQNIKKKPYSFVDGWKGLKTLLRYFQGNELGESQPSREKGYNMSPLYGYSYGKLFFYYPDQFNIRFVVKGFMEAARNHSEAGEDELAYDVLSEAMKIVGMTDQWLIQERGTTALRLGRVQDARVWLNAAIRLQHKWLAPTRSFIDPTSWVPRADGVTQHETLPHSAPTAAFGAVTASKHVVMYISPARADDGLWYFPALLRSVVPQEHQSLENFMKAHGAALGELEYSFSRYDGKGTSEAMVALSMLYMNVGDIYRMYTDTTEVVLGERFWMEYALRRWHIPSGYLEIASSANQQQRQEFAKMLGGTIGNIQKELNKAEEDSEKAFYLHGSWKTLEDLAKRFTRGCPNKEQRKLTQIRLRAAMEALNPGMSIEKIDFSGDLY